MKKLKTYWTVVGRTRQNLEWSGFCSLYDSRDIADRWCEEWNEEFVDKGEYRVAKVEVEE
jgi:hypothetical protein